MAVANPLILARNAKRIIDKNGETVTLTWPSVGKEGLLNGGTSKAQAAITTKAFIYEQEIKLEGGGVAFQKRGLFYDVGRSLTRASVKGLDGQTYTVKSVTTTKPNDVTIIHVVVLS